MLGLASVQQESGFRAGSTSRAEPCHRRTLFPVSRAAAAPSQSENEAPDNSERCLSGSETRGQARPQTPALIPPSRPRGLWGRNRTAGAPPAAVTLVPDSGGRIVRRPRTGGRPGPITGRGQGRGLQKRSRARALGARRAGASWQPLPWPLWACRGRGGALPLHLCPALQLLDEESSLSARFEIQGINRKCEGE